jgi:hypothetical protein
MSLQLEITEAVAAMKAAAKEAGDVVAMAAKPEELPDDFEGRGYAFIVQRINDVHNVVNNALRDIGETPVIPAAPAPREVIKTETEEVLVEVVKEVDRQSTLDELDGLRAQIAKKDQLLDEATQEIELVMAENQKLKAEAGGASEKMLNELEAVKDTLDARETPFNFGTDFLEAEKVGDEDRPAINQRLLEELEELTQSKAANSPEQDKRREHLRSAFYKYRG